MLKSKENVKKIIAMLQSFHQGSLSDMSQLSKENLEVINDTIISLGESLVPFQEQAISVFPLLEQYAQNIVNLEQYARQGHDVKAITNSILEQIAEISATVESVLPSDKKIVYFLPYKASMWDSLESVWREAAADENIAAYVMPIPYYVKNPDGSFKEYHWEIDQYPKEVPVVDYHGINLRDIHPDKIYIHNPYDESNHIASVDPEFYSKKIKDYTDELIYIPYFVVNEENLTPQSIEHLVIYAGVIYSHKVIVQSEKVRQCYIKVLVDEFGDQYKSYFSKKICWKDSPKLDKVRNTKREDVYIPNEWKKHILKPDGTWKKIILYNNSIGYLLNYCDKMLDKYRNTLEIFKANRDKVCLLWRPHPLIESTMKSMHPELLAEYMKIVNEYRKDDWGIYDDTSDLNRAIAISDGYYGDRSSVVRLFKEAGKICMIQNPEVIL